MQNSLQMKSGIQLIIEEQHRYLEQKGRTNDHNECWVGKLALIAACYAEFAYLPDTERVEQTISKASYWPWDEEWWRPENPLHDLVQAGALIAVEIDRLLNAEQIMTDPVTE